MSDLLEAVEVSISRKVDGADRTFAFLNAYDRAELLRADLKRRQDAWDARKQKLIANLKLAALDKEQMFKELEAFDNDNPEEVTEQDWINFVNSPLNDVSIFTASLGKTYPDDAEALAKKTGLPLADKAKLCGLIVSAAEPETSDPNTGTPAVYGTPAAENSSGESQRPASDITSPA